MYMVWILYGLIKKKRNNKMGYVKIVENKENKLKYLY